VEQPQHGVAAVTQQHQGPVGQPAPQLEDNLSGPIGEFLGPTPPALVETLQGSQGSEHRQGPDPLVPGDGSQPHQADPAQATGLDQMAGTGAYGITVDAPCANAPTPTAFQGLMDTEHQRALAGIQIAQQEKEETLAQFSGRPAGPVEHMMILGETPFLGQAQDPQSRRDGALAWGEDRPNQEQLSFGSGRGTKHWQEGGQKVYKYSGQGKHG
jgi:hypothetical protein